MMYKMKLTLHWCLCVASIRKEMRKRMRSIGGFYVLYSIQLGCCVKNYNGLSFILRLMKDVVRFIFCNIVNVLEWEGYLSLYPYFNIHVLEYCHFTHGCQAFLLIVNLPCNSTTMVCVFLEARASLESGPSVTESLTDSLTHSLTFKVLLSYKPS